MDDPASRVDSAHPRTPKSLGVGATAAAVVFVVVGLSYGIPFLGLPLSLLLLVFPAIRGPRLWRVSRRSSWAWAAVAWLGLWLPALVDFLTPLFFRAGIQSSTSWLLVPLCGPDARAAWYLPALAAALGCSLGALAAIRVARPWPWVLSAWLAPWVHWWVFSLVPADFIC